MAQTIGQIRCVWHEIMFWMTYYLKVSIDMVWIERQMCIDSVASQLEISFLIIFVIQPDFKILSFWLHPMRFSKYCGINID